LFGLGGKDKYRFFEFFSNNDIFVYKKVSLMKIFLQKRYLNSSGNIVIEDLFSKTISLHL